MASEQVRYCQHLLLILHFTPLFTRTFCRWSNNKHASTAERLKLRRFAICRSSFDTNSVIDAATTSLRCVFLLLVCVKTVVLLQARKLAAAAFLQRRCVLLLRLKTTLRCDNVPVEFIPAWPWFIYSSEHRLAVAGNLTEMHSSAEGRCICSTDRNVSESRRISMSKTVLVFLLCIQTVNQAGALLDVDDRVARFGVTPRSKGHN